MQVAAVMLALAASAALRVAVVPAGADLPDAGAFDARVASIAEAVAWVKTHATAAASAATPGSDAPSIDIVLAPCVHVVRETVQIPAGIRGLSLIGSPGTRVVGGVVASKPAWEIADDAARALVPVEAREHLRMWRLADEARAQLAGPVHSGLGIDTPAVHSELFVGGRALTLARWPNAGYAAIAAIEDPGSVPRNAMADVPVAKRVVEPDRGGAFVPADTSHAARWDDAPDAWALGFWNWDWAHEQLPIASVDAKSGAVKLAMPHRYGLAQRGHFCVLNAPAELDSEGEYWIDRARGMVCAWLPAGGADAEAAVSLLGEPLLALADAHDCTIRGIAFECTRGAAIDARGGERVRIERCAFRNIGARAVALDGHANLVERCDFTDIGGTGVLLIGGDRATLARGDAAIDSCTFRECGRVLRSYSPAVVVEGVGNRVTHCAITRHPHIALWFRGNDHLIEANEISEVVYETGDAGAVYTGRDWTAQGTVIRGNFFHDIRGSDERYQNAVYLDDMASGITVEDNVFVRCNWGALVGGGRDNALRRNTFVACAKAVSWDARGVGWMAGELKDPETSTLLRGYAVMPVTSDVWKARYPNLGDYLSFQFGRPVRGVFAENRLVATPLGRIDDRELVIESGTVVLESIDVAEAAKGVGPR